MPNILTEARRVCCSKFWNNLELAFLLKQKITVLFQGYGQQIATERVTGLISCVCMVAHGYCVINHIEVKRVSIYFTPIPFELFDIYMMLSWINQINWIRLPCEICSVVIVPHPLHYSVNKQAGMQSHLWPLLLTWFNFNPSMDK